MNLYHIKHTFEVKFRFIGLAAALYKYCFAAYCINREKVLYHNVFDLIPLTKVFIDIDFRFFSDIGSWKDSFET